MYRIAICDNDRNYINELKTLLLAYGRDERKMEFWEFTSGRALLNSETDEMDVIFVDIQMQDLDGNEISLELKRRGYQGLLVQCSIFMPTPETIKISPFRYFLKQCPKEEIMSELGEIFDELDSRKICTEIEGFYQREKITFRVADILYITHHSNGKSVLHLKEEQQKRYTDGNVIVPYNFDELMRRLETAGFAVPHNSYIVNLRYVTYYNRQKEFLEVGGKQLSVSRGRKEQFFEKLEAVQKSNLKCKK